MNTTTSTTCYLTLAEGKIAYDDTETTGPLVICVPGMADLRQEYRFLTPQLIEAGYRVVTMDLRGFGESSANWSDYSVRAQGEDILALIRYLNAGPAIVIGNSIAGAAAIYAAAQAPHLVAGLVLLDPVVRDLSPMWQARLLYGLLFADLWGASVWGWYYPTLFKTGRPDDFEAYRKVQLTSLREPGRVRALRRMLSIPRKSASEDRVGQVQAPTLLVMGSKDPDFKNPAQEVQWLQEHMTGTRVTVSILDGVGHYPQTEVPQQVGPQVIAFLQQVKGTSTSGTGA